MPMEDDMKKTYMIEKHEHFGWMIYEWRGFYWAGAGSYATKEEAEREVEKRKSEVKG